MHCKWTKIIIYVPNCGNICYKNIGNCQVNVKYYSWLDLQEVSQYIC